MRTLVITRGLPGSGKSTFIRERGWAPYAIEPDALRLLHRGPEMQMDGSLAVSDKVDSAVWKQVYALLEERMAEGAFTVLDATHLYAQSLHPYRKLVERYRYRLYVLDFTGVPMEELLRRNENRGLHRVPEGVLLRMARRSASVELPRWVTVLKPADWEQILWRPMELDSYRRVLHIGDIHGCYTALRTLLPENEPMEDTYYIFHGDLVDRGTENAAVVEFLARWAECPNVAILEGNHEASLRAFAGMEGPAPAEYELYTRKELADAGLSPEVIKNLYRRTRQCCHYTYHGRKVFACHGGVPGLADNPLYINTRQLIQGVGGYGQAEKVALAWDASMPPDYYQVYGHRNRGGLPVQASGRVFNLEGQVEFGGCLRAVELTEQGFRPIEIPNPVPSAPEMQHFTPWLFQSSPRPAKQEAAPDAPAAPDAAGVVAVGGRRNYGVHRINADMDACALFKDNVTGGIVARGYDAIPSVSEGWSSLRFPVTAYIKENGFLGLAGFDHRNDQVVLTTRRSLTGPLIRTFRMALDWSVDRDGLKDYLRESRTTLAFEIVGCWESPHIIPYESSEAILMDEIHNTPEFCCTPYKSLCRLAEKLGRTPASLMVKKQERVIRSQQELRLFMRDNEHREIEGFIFEDAEGRRFFDKTTYYYHWWWRRRHLLEWRKGLPDRSEIRADEPFLLWAHDYLTSHPEAAGPAINFHTLREIFWRQNR